MMMRRSGRGEESGNTPRQEKRCQPRFFTQKTQLPPAFLRSWKDAVVTGVFRDLKRHRSVLSFGKFCQPRSKGLRLILDRVLVLSAYILRVIVCGAVLLMCETA
jgi:hypothetical protein